MKKYRICLFLFLGVSLVCVLIALFCAAELGKQRGRGTHRKPQSRREAAPETVTEDQMAANKDHVQAVAESREKRIIW